MVALVLVACSVGLDNFGAATSIGVRATSRTGWGRIVVVFGLFEGLMPVAGIVVGHGIAHVVGGSAHVVAGGLLCLAGAYALLGDVVAHRPRREPSSLETRYLVTLALILSLDNLVIGFALGAYHVGMAVAAVILGSVSAALTLAGLELGRRLAGRLGQAAEALGGVVLLGVGASILAGV